MSKFANIPGVIVGEVGLKVSRYPVERLKMSVNKRYRISPVMDNILIVKTHYAEDIGSFVCFDGACCEVIGLPSIRYLVPVVIYNTNAKGQCVSQEVENKVLVLGKDAYDSLLVIKENFKTISDIDIIVTCTDEKYQKIQLQAVGAC